MEETSKTSDKHEERLEYSDLIDLYKHYWTVMLAELDFCQRYLNFYSGLLSAILAATLAGLLSLKFRGLDELTLLLGPLLMFVLAYNGYNTVKTFYIRFVEAWVTTLNLESMLDIRYSPRPITPIASSRKPRYISNQGSFIPTFEDDRLKEILEGTKKEGTKKKKWFSFIQQRFLHGVRTFFLHRGEKKEVAEQEKKKGAEQVTKELSESRKGTTLANAKITFIAFAVAAAILILVIVLTYLYPQSFLNMTSSRTGISLMSF